MAPARRREAPLLLTILNSSDTNPSLSPAPQRVGGQTGRLGLVQAESMVTSPDPDQFLRGNRRHPKPTPGGHGPHERRQLGDCQYEATGSHLRCTLVPSVSIPSAKCSLVTTNGRKGLRVSSESGDRSYTAWFTPEGLVSIVADHIPQIQVKDCHLRYGLLPSFAGTDVCFAPERMRSGGEFRIPSTQWLVGLVDGNDSMLVAVWESDTQAVSLGLVGEGASRRIDSVTIATAKAGFSLSLVEHAQHLAPGSPQGGLACRVRPDCVGTPVPGPVDVSVLRHPCGQAHVSGTLHGLLFPHRQCQDPAVGRLV